MSPSLTVVADKTPEFTARELLSIRVQQLQAEAKKLAKDHVAALVSSMGDVEQIAQEISTGGDVYPPGIRDLARRLVEQMDAQMQIVEAISRRT